MTKKVRNIRHIKPRGISALEDMQLQRDDAIRRELALREERNELMSELRFVRSMLSQNITARLRRENPIFDGDIRCILDHINARCPP